MKKQWIILISLMMILGGIVWFNCGSEAPIVIKGNLSAKDVAEIKRVVRSTLKRQIFPSVSWDNVKRLHDNFKNYSRLKLTSIEIDTNSYYQVMAFFEVPTNKPAGTFPSFFGLNRNGGRWVIVGAGGDVGN